MQELTYVTQPCSSLESRQSNLLSHLTVPGKHSLLPQRNSFFLFLKWQQTLITRLETPRARCSLIAAFHSRGPTAAEVKRFRRGICFKRTFHSLTCLRRFCNRFAIVFQRIFLVITIIQFDLKVELYRRFKDKKDHLLVRVWSLLY